jgi:integrase/recombinase XerC
LSPRTEREGKGPPSPSSSSSALKKPYSLPSLAEEFLIHQKNLKNRSQNTLIAYRHELTRYGAYLESKGSSYLQASKTFLRGFVFHLRGSLGNASIARALSVIKTFYGWIIKEGYADRDMTASVKSPKLPKRQPRFLSPSEIDALLGPMIKRADKTLQKKTPPASPSSPSSPRLAPKPLPSGAGLGEEPGAPPLDKRIIDKRVSAHLIRDEAILELAYSSGLRVSELTGLDLKDIDFRRGEVRIRLGKGGKDRIVPVGVTALRKLQKWLLKRPSYLLRSGKDPDLTKDPDPTKDPDLKNGDASSIAPSPSHSPSPPPPRARGATLPARMTRLAMLPSP